LYLVCCVCHVGLPPAACHVDDLHTVLKRQTSSFHLHQDHRSSHIQGQTTLLACNRLSPLSRIPRFHLQSRDGAVISQSCLHSPAKIVVERQSQLTGFSLSALEPRQITRKPCRQTVLLAAVYCAKDPCTSLNCQTHPSNIPLMALDRAPSEVTQSVCLQSSTSPCSLVPSFLTGGVLYSVLQDAQQKL
jgi:hypothetical protein